MPGDLDALHVDTSFLQDYRPEGHDPSRNAGPDVDATPARERDLGAGSRQERGGAGSDGAVAAGAGSPPPPVVRDSETLDPPEPEPEHRSPAHDRHAYPQPELELPLWQDKSDHQDAVQQLTTRGGSAASGGPPVLPKSGFHVSGQENQPQIKALPAVIVTALRGQLRAAAVRELGASHAQATEFSQKISQKALVIGFLTAQLDLRLETDPATGCVTRLFQTRDPLLGSVAARLERLEHAGEEHLDQISRLREENRALQATAAVIEHAVAYTITERAEGLLRGVNTVADVPYTDKRVLQMRDRARDETAQQARIEKERDGRPRR